MNILQRLNAVQKEVDYVQKERKQGMRYSIVSHDAVTAKVRPLMVKHGVLYYPLGMDLDQVGNRTQMRITVRFCNIDEPTDYIDVMTAGYGIDESDKGPGKAISYSVKYALLKALGLETGDDPDQDQNSTFKPREEDYPQGDFAASPDAAPAKSSAELKRMKFWPDFEREVAEAQTMTSLETVRKVWKAIADRDGWNPAWRHGAQEVILGRKQAIMAAMSPEALAEVPLGDALRASVVPGSHDDIFPGDRFDGQPT